MHKVCPQDARKKNKAYLKQPISFIRDCKYKSIKHISANFQLSDQQYTENLYQNNFGLFSTDMNLNKLQILGSAHVGLFTSTTVHTPNSISFDLGQTRFFTFIIWHMPPIFYHDTPIIIYSKAESANWSLNKGQSGFRGLWHHCSWKRLQCQLQLTLQS